MKRLDEIKKVVIIDANKAQAIKGGEDVIINTDLDVV